MSSFVVETNEPRRLKVIESFRVPKQEAAARRAMIVCSPQLRFIALLWSSLSSVASTAHAHGGPPAALGIVAASERGPSVVLLNEGLAAQRGERWSFLCPRLWGDADVSSGKVPLARSTDGRRTWIAGADDLYAAEGGRLTPQHRPDLSSAHLTMFASIGEALYGLRIADGGAGSEIVRIGSTAGPPLWAASSYFSALAAGGEHLYLARIVTDLEVAFVTLDREGRIVAESRTVTDTITARVDVQPTPAGLFAVTYDGLSSTLHRLDGSTWRRVLAGEGVLYGPQASPTGSLWISLNGVLMRESAGGFEPAGETRAVTCLGVWGDETYACVDGEMFWLTGDGLGERCFHLEGFTGPDPAVVPPSAARECDFQWTLFRNDLMLAGHRPQDWIAESPAAPEAGGAGTLAMAGSGVTAGSDGVVAGGVPAADGGGNSGGGGSAVERPGCSCAVPGGRATHSWMFAVWCTVWLAVALCRRRARLLAALAGLSPLVLELASSAVLGQSLPAQRVDRADVEHRALAVATYDGGEVTVGELQDAIAVMNPLVQEDALAPAELRKLLARSVQFELMAIEAERRGYGERPVVQEAIKQNAVHRLLAREVDAKLPPDKQAFGRATPSPERDSMIESLIAELRKTEPAILRPELLSQIRIEDDGEATAAPK